MAHYDTYRLVLSLLPSRVLVCLTGEAAYDSFRNLKSNTGRDWHGASGGDIVSPHQHGVSDKISVNTEENERMNPKRRKK
jgi:hypothetical protein